MSPLQKTYFGVYGVVINEGMILCVKKTRGPYIGKYDLPGGGIQHGETLVEALRREVEEEVGIVEFFPVFVRDFSFVTPYHLKEKLISFHHIAFLYKLTNVNISNYNPSLTAEDVNGSAWVKSSLLDRNNTSPLLYEASR